MKCQRINALSANQASEGALKNSKESHPIQMAVDATKLARCKWCGRMKGDRWPRTDAESYCSIDCAKADHASSMILFFLLVVAVSPIGILLVGPLSPSIIVLGFLIFIIVGFPFLRFGHSGFRYRSKVPRDSRRNEGTSGVDLMKALPSRVCCPNCDANIDLEKVSEDMVYTCENCGVSGNIEIL